jgi:hypothetical protein
MDHVIEGLNPFNIIYIFALQPEIARRKDHCVCRFAVPASSPRLL